jgi:hypothetical protein
MKYLLPDNRPKPPQKLAAEQYHLQVPGQKFGLPPGLSAAYTAAGVNLKDSSITGGASTDGGRQMPKKPEKGSVIDTWFDFYYICRLRGINYNFKELVLDTGLQPGYIRLLHRLYRREHHLE